MSTERNKTWGTVYSGPCLNDGKMRAWLYHKNIHVVRMNVVSKGPPRHRKEKQTRTTKQKTNKKGKIRFRFFNITSMFIPNDI